MRKFPVFAVAVVLGVWAVIGAVIYFVRSAKPTPEKVMTYVSSHPVEGRSPAERQRVIQKLAQQLNQLTYEQRREVRFSRQLDGVFRQLSPEEQGYFLDLTAPAGFKQMMEAFNKMEPAKRKAVVAKALADMKKQGERDTPVPEDPNMQKIVDVGLRSFYSDASAETKLDLSPLIEQLQRNLQGLH